MFLRVVEVVNFISFVFYHNTRKISMGEKKPDKNPRVPFYPREALGGPMEAIGVQEHNISFWV